MKNRPSAVALLLVALFPLVACGPDGPGTDASEPDASSSSGEADARPQTEATESPPRAESGTTGSASEERRREPVDAEPTGTEMVPGQQAGQGEADGEQPGEEPARRVRTAAAGTQVWATLTDSLDSESAEVGDRFSAEVGSPVTDGAYVLLPAGARLHGHVTQVRRARRDTAAMIALDFDSVTVRQRTLPLAATVTDVKLEERSEMKGEAKKIGIGAAAGAVVGAVVGKDVKGALIGAAGGAAAGTAVALGTRAEYAVLPAGSEVTLELDEPLEVPLPRE